MAEKYVIVRKEPDEGMRRAAIDAAPLYPEYTIVNGERQRTDRRVSMTDKDCYEIFQAMLSASRSLISLEEIVEVLETVAGQIKGNWHHQPDDTPIVMGLHAHDLRLKVKLGDLRRAHALLSRLKEMEGGQ